MTTDSSNTLKYYTLIIVCLNLYFIHKYIYNDNNSKVNSIRDVDLEMYDYKKIIGNETYTGINLAVFYNDKGCTSCIKNEIAFSYLLNDRYGLKVINYSLTKDLSYLKTMGLDSVKYLSDNIFFNKTNPIVVLLLDSEYVLYSYIPDINKKNIIDVNHENMERIVEKYIH